jgi:polysaccharide chain length determinant protein (PEP-CTERM system associated)
MNDITQNMLTTLRGIWRHRWLAIIVAWCVALPGALVVNSTSERYEARARIYVDTQTVLKPLMAGLAYQPDIDQQVRMLGRTLVSRPNAERLVNDPKIGLLAGNPATVDQIADDLAKAIKVEQTGGNNLYAISYRDTDSRRAQRVVEGLVSIFVDSGADSKRRDSADASRFIDEQIKSYEGKLTEAETRLKDFKLRNMGVAGSGTANQDYFGRITSLNDDVARLKVESRAAERSRDSLKHELSQESPSLPVEPVAAGPVVSATPELDGRIDAARRQLDELLRRYTDEHPDVIATKRNIGQLEAQRRHDNESRPRTASAASTAIKGQMAPTSPVYQRLRIALAEAEAKVSSLQGQIDAQQHRIDEIRTQATKAPQAEAELSQLNRDYEIIRKNYEQLVARREAASLGVKIDQNGSLADFRLIEPPRVLPNPVFPGKRLLALAVMLAALLAGAVAAYVRSVMNPTFASERELREFTRRPVLGSLGLVSDPARLAVVSKDRQRVLLALGAYLIVHAAWMGWVVLHSAG